MPKTYLLTGTAGFIASKTAEFLLKAGHKVVGVDNLNDYYDPRFKVHRLKALQAFSRFTFKKADIENILALKNIFENYRFDAVLNLAAAVGVRHSIKYPDIFLTTNVLGTFNLLELANTYKVPKFVLASSSSLYAGRKMPFKETMAVNKLFSPYAASKKRAEDLCHIYHRLYGIDVSIVRYFTVYGPAGRPDMAVLAFIKQIDEGHPIQVLGDGTQARDFTYVDDIALGTIKAIRKTGFKVINLGRSDPYKLEVMIGLIEKNLGKKAKIIYKSFHKADIKGTSADISEAKKTLGWAPKIGLDQGVRNTVDWYKKNKRLLKR